jgi:hypothetical protein
MDILIGILTAPVFWGVVLTGLWLSAVLTYYLINHPKFSVLPPNQLGDVFAGAFAPLAFLWLVVTVFVQAEDRGIAAAARDSDTISQEFSVAAKAVGRDFYQIKLSVFNMTTKKEEPHIFFGANDYDNRTSEDPYGLAATIKDRIDGLLIVDKSLTDLRIVDLDDTCRLIARIYGTLTSTEENITSYSRGKKLPQYGILKDLKGAVVNLNTRIFEERGTDCLGSVPTSAFRPQP